MKYSSESIVQQLLAGMESLCPLQLIVAQFFKIVKNSLSSISFENLFRMRPEGVTSKKAIGEFMIDFKTSSCTCNQTLCHFALRKIPSMIPWSWWSGYRHPWRNRKQAWQQWSGRRWVGRTRGWDCSWSPLWTPPQCGSWRSRCRWPSASPPGRRHRRPRSEARWRWQVGEEQKDKWRERGKAGLDRRRSGSNASSRLPSPWKIMYKLIFVVGWDERPLHFQKSRPSDPFERPLPLHPCSNLLILVKKGNKCKKAWDDSYQACFSCCSLFRHFSWRQTWPCLQKDHSEFCRSYSQCALVILTFLLISSSWVPCSAILPSLIKITCEQLLPSASFRFQSWTKEMCNKGMIFNNID